MKKKLLLTLVIFFITLSSNIAYSQDVYVPPTVKIDSIIQHFPAIVFVNVYASFDKGSDSIIEKGYEVGEEFSHYIYLIPIENESFDTVLLFYPIQGRYFINAYLKTDSSIIRSDTSIFFVPDVNLPKEEDEDIKSIKVYPTIIEDYINFSSLVYPIDISIIDVLGKEYIKETLYINTRLNCNQLKAGVYNMIIRYKDKKMINRKFLKK